MKDKRHIQIDRTWVFILLQIGVVIFAFTVGFLVHRLFFQYQGELGLLRQARDLLLENSILDIPDERTLQHGMIGGMLATLDDPYTYFVEPAGNEVQKDQLAGSYGGIGVQLERDTQMNWRLFPLPDSPALEAGLQAGDRLLKIDNLVVTTEMDPLNLVAAMRGPVGERLSLTVARKGETLTFRIERQTVPLPSVTHYILPEAPRIGMVLVNRIAETTAEEITNAILDQKNQGAEAFIMDLRDNGGGLVEAGVAITRLFLSEGEILYQQFKGQPAEIFQVEEQGRFTEIPMVVLVNGNTASSAEIIAGALHTHQGARLVGSPTYGKTSIQFIYDLEDGSSIHVTSGRWWIPGVDFPLQPDFFIGEDPSGVLTLKTAIDILSKVLN